MLLVRATRFGGPDVLVAGEAAGPIAGVGDVVIGVAVADTLHLDTVIRRGAFPFMVVEPPYVPGGGVAGEVLAVGPDVDQALIGTRVVARTGAGAPGTGVETVAQLAQRDSHTGGYAEQALVPATAVVPVPAELSLQAAAALVNDGMTAMLLCETARIRHGESVLISPGGGGLGNLLVQLAHTAGTHVIGAARGERKRERARDSGADATIDYEQETWVDQARVLTGGRGADVVLDGVGGEIGRSSLDVTARGGRFIGYGAPGGEFTQVSAHEAGRRDVQALSLLDLPVPAGDQQRLTERALAEAAAGRITPLIGQTFPLVQAADAHTAIEARTVIGKTLLIVASA